MKQIYKTVTNVVGMDYRRENAEKAISLMKADESNNVKLVREPSNPYDHLAIKVYLEGVFIGYVPKKGMKELRKIIQRKDILIKAKAMLLYLDGEKYPDCILFVEIWELFDN
ncbi:HIRAN domain-containing protein [Streptococcus suis]|uniref:HIRAN domain-containing protein n=1 Tax=Streptococcus suis TaxID=1307 RepID=UPI00209BB38C|nr:HIRAN domain-containing protein [Streptococcus suis]MCO8241145.1 HIRAN domain-containing protein [Streptococcus suis]